VAQVKTFIQGSEKATLLDFDETVFTISKIGGECHVVSPIRKNRLPSVHPWIWVYAPPDEKWQPERRGPI